MQSRTLPRKSVLKLLTPGPLEAEREWGEDPSDPLPLPQRRTATADGGSESWTDLRWQYLEHLVLDR